MSEKDTANLLAIVGSCTKIQDFVDEVWDADSFHADEKTFDAVLMNFVIIGEAVARLSTELKTNETEVPWQKIKGFRNLVAHDYFGVDAEEVWQIIQNNLPTLKIQLKTIISSDKK